MVTACRRIDVLWHCNGVACLLGRRYFLKKVIPSCSKFEITYEGVQFSEVTGLQPATLLKIDSFIDMKQRFQRCVHKNLPHSFNLLDKCRRLFIFKYLDHSINWKYLNGQCILRFTLSSREFLLVVHMNLMFMCNERNHSICYTTARHEVHAFQNKN